MKKVLALSLALLMLLALAACGDKEPTTRVTNTTAVSLNRNPISFTYSYEASGMPSFDAEETWIFESGMFDKATGFYEFKEMDNPNYDPENPDGGPEKFTAEEAAAFAYTGTYPGDEPSEEDQSLMSVDEYTTSAVEGNKITFTAERGCAYVDSTSTFLAQDEKAATTNADGTEANPATPKYYQGRKEMLNRLKTGKVTNGYYNPENITIKDEAAE